MMDCANTYVDEFWLDEGMIVTKFMFARVWDKINELYYTYEGKQIADFTEKVIEAVKRRY